MADKPLRWVGSSLEDLSAFPEPARRQAGYQLRRIQQGLLPDDWRPMPSVGTGVAEMAIYVLHAFEKRTRQTRHLDLELGRKRLAEVIRSRRSR